MVGCNYFREPNCTRHGPSLSSVRRCVTVPYIGTPTLGAWRIALSELHCSTRPEGTLPYPNLMDLPVLRGATSFCTFAMFTCDTLPVPARVFVMVFHCFNLASLRPLETGTRAHKFKLGTRSMFDLYMVFSCLALRSCLGMYKYGNGLIVDRRYKMQTTNASQCEPEIAIGFIFAIKWEFQTPPPPLTCPIPFGNQTPCTP